MNSGDQSRRAFLKRCVIGTCGAAVAGTAAYRFLGPGRPDRRLSLGFPNDAPENLGPWSCEAEWYEKHLNLLTCKLCPHQCVLAENDRGFCRVRVVRDGRLHSLVYGNPCAVHIDPMEKKPLYHFLPGKRILSIATAGCNLRCLNCQNWQISQSTPREVDHAELPPDSLLRTVRKEHIPAIAYTYSEPVVFYEYTKTCSELAHAEGIRNVLVTAAYIQEKPLRALCKVVDAANVDLKAFDDRVYRRLIQGRLQPVLDALRIMKEEGVWVEVTRLIVPRYSDDLEDVRRMCRWIVENLGNDVPLHLSRFHPHYRLTRLPPTPLQKLEAATEIAREEGLHYVYVGNVPGRAGQNTQCPKCGREVIRRKGYLVGEMELENGRCGCGHPIAGVWS